MEYTNLKVEMLKKHVTNTDIAKLLGVHRNTVDNKLSGRSAFSVDEAFKIFYAFFSDADFYHIFYRKNPNLDESA